MKKIFSFLIIIFLIVASTSFVEAKKEKKKVQAKSKKVKVISKKTSKKKIVLIRAKQPIDDFIIQRKKRIALLKSQQEIHSNQLPLPPSFSLAATAAPVAQVSTVEAVIQKSVPIIISPKLAFFSGDFSGAALGLEYEIANQSGLVVSADGLYKLEGHGISWFQIGGLAKYLMPMEQQPFMPYVGGGINYNIYMISGDGSASGVGIKLFAGADIPVAGTGTLFANVGYTSQSFNYSIAGLTINASGSGIYIEGGYRLSI